MVGVTAVESGDHVEEQEHVTDAHVVVGQMALRGTGLAEGAAPSLEYRIVVAEARCGQLATGDPLDDVAESEIPVGSLRTFRAREWGCSSDGRG